MAWFQLIDTLADSTQQELMRKMAPKRIYGDIQKYCIQQFLISDLEADCPERIPDQLFLRIPR